MTGYLKLYGWVLLISFAGSLPIGTLNSNIANLAISMGFSEAVLFGVAAILVEVILVRIAVVAVKRLEKLRHLFRLFSIVACIVLLLFACISLEAAFHMRTPEMVFPFTKKDPFLSGLLLSSLNPLHLPHHCLVVRYNQTRHSLNGFANFKPSSLALPLLWTINICFPPYCSLRLSIFVSRFTARSDCRSLFLALPLTNHHTIT